uniref:IQ motif containing K n=1 Tax=Equus caballus TaxID=9796 RepID=F7D4A8_HORSE
QRRALRTHPSAKLPRLHVRARSAVTRKSLSGRCAAPGSSGSFRVAAVRGARLPWKPRPWRRPGGWAAASPSARSGPARPSRGLPAARPWPPWPPSRPSRRGRWRSRPARTCGSRSARVSPLEETVFRGFRAEQLFPVSQSPTASRIPCPQVKEETADPKTCSPREFLETFIFPILLPGMTNLLHQAKKEKCFERKKTKFVACDFLTEWLYNHNPKRTEEPFTEFFSIPFVEQWLQLHPRPPIPLSLLLTEEEAALTIQSFWRAYLVRCDPEIQELRQWQKKLRENKHIHQRVRIFWAKQEQKVKCKMEDEEEAAAKAPP